MGDNILILDTETTGLSVTKGDKIIEIAVVLFNIKHKSILQSFSSLLPCEENPVEKINHISAQLTQCNYPYILEPDFSEKIWNNPNAPSSILYDEEPQYFMDSILIEMAKVSRFVVAHNAEFDKAFVKQLNCGQFLLEKPWVCTKKNFTWPVHLQRFRLEDICNAMQVSYVQAHRALNDCLLLSQCFQQVNDLQERFDRASPIDFN